MSKSPALLTEKEMQANIVREAKALGWQVHSTWNAMHSPAGYPDLTLVRDGKLLFFELKTAIGVVSEAQKEWLYGLAKVAGVGVMLVRPDNLEAAYEMLV